MRKYNEERKRSYNVMEKITGSIEALNAIQITQKVAGLDIACKTILKNKEFLAVILKYVAEEYKECTISEIMDFIEKETITSPELTTGRTNTQIAGDNLEFSQLNEKTSKFDILFRVKDPKLSTQEIQVNLMVDIEPQKNYQPGYPIEKRGIYYCSRMIFAQYETEFTSSHYENVKKVYSIWICMNPPKNRENSITRYYIVEENLVGNVKERKADYDLMAAVMICLGREEDSNIDLLKLLNVLLSTEKDSEDKCQILEDDFHIKMAQTLESEVSLMCNLSKGVEEKGFEKGRQEGIIAMVSALKDLQIADSIILNKIQEKFHLAEETAKRYL